MVAADIQVIGRVQGVFFRASAKAMADRLKIFGWVRNEPDGSVRIFAEGEKQAVDDLINWCNHGPDAAHVDELHLTTVEPIGYDQFQIIR